ncbi:hypothetical protein Aduo_004376 [Ancylostoma duodenale]
MADTAAEGCPEKPSQPQLPGYGIPGVLSASETIKADFDCNEAAGAMIEKLWKNGAKIQNDTKIQNNNDAFTQMAFDYSSGFACTQQVCGKKYYLLCFYQRNALGYKTLYKSGNSLDDLCSGCRPKCEDALCREPLSPLSDKASSKVCAGCSKELKDDFRLTAVYMHNYYRRLLATGWAKDKQIQYAKPAKAMNELVYVKPLEDAALNYVKNCDNTAPENDPPVGESFWRGKSGSYQLSHVEAMEQAMKEWWGPLESTGLGNMLEYTTETQNGPLKYFANIVHDKTKQIGCAAKTCQKQGVTLVDCRYNTTVAVGDPVYEVGKMPCKCPAGTTCSKLGGLCEATQATP